MNAQRTSVYQMRRQVLSGEMGRDYVDELNSNILDWILKETIGWRRTRRHGTIRPARRALSTSSACSSRQPSSRTATTTSSRRTCAPASRRCSTRSAMSWARRCSGRLIQFSILSTIDEHWKDHLYQLDHLKEGISLRGYGGRQPLVEYKKESFEMFQAMQESYENEVIKRLFRLAGARSHRRRPRARGADDGADLRIGRKNSRSRGRAASAAAGPAPNVEQRRAKRKVGRNEPAPAARARSTRNAACSRASSTRSTTTRRRRNDPPRRHVENGAGGLRSALVLSFVNRTRDGDRNSRSGKRVADMLEGNPPLALSYDDVLVVPARLEDPAARRGRLHPADPQHRAQHPAGQRRDGHRHRGNDGHRHRPPRRHRRHPQEPHHRGAGRRGRQGQALGERHDRRTRSPSAPTAPSARRSR